MSRLQSTYGPLLRVIFLACSFLLGSGMPAGHAGNRQMVEDRTEQLGELNEQAIRQIPEELPQNGQIEATAEVVQEQGETKVEVQDYSITRGKILRNNQNQGGKEGGRRNTAFPAAIR